MIDDGASTAAIVRPARLPGIDRVVIVDLPLAARPPPGVTMGAMVAAAAREVLDRGSVGAAPDEEARDPAEDGGEAAEAPSLDEAVIRAHEQRIAVLHARLDAARADKAAPRLLADMGKRLQRAEAARRLAAGRLIGDGIAVAAAAPALPLAASASARIVRASIGVRPARHRLASPALPTGLARARRSLAAARRSLAARPAIVIASLWQWSGSAHWSLRPDRPVAS